MDEIPVSVNGDLMGICNCITITVSTKCNLDAHALFTKMKALQPAEVSSETRK